MNKEQNSSAVIPPPYSSGSNDRNSSLNDEISFKDIILKFKGWWKFILSKWIIIVLASLFGGGLGFLYAYSDIPIYTASTTFVLEEDNSGGGGMLGQFGGLAGIAGIDLGSGGGLFRGDNIIELYKSRNMVEKTLLSKVLINGKEQQLIEKYIEFNSLRKAWSNNKELKNIKFDVSTEKEFSRIQDSILGSTVKIINSNYLTVSRLDKKLSIINVEVRAADEVFAKVFNDQIVKTVNDFYVITKTKKSLENISILQHQTDSVRRELDGEIYSAAAIVDATPNLNSTRQVLRSPAQKSQFNAEANKVILTHLIQNLELGKLSLRKEMPLIQIVDSPKYPLNKKKFGKARGLFLGGVLMGFLATMLLIIHRLYVKILNGD